MSSKDPNALEEIANKNKKTVQDSQISSTMSTDIVSHSYDVNADSFKMHKVIGKGAFGMVYLAQKRDTGTFYAIKSLKKEHI